MNIIAHLLRVHSARLPARTLIITEGVSHAWPSKRFRGAWSGYHLNGYLEFHLHKHPNTEVSTCMTS